MLDKSENSMLVQWEDNTGSLFEANLYQSQPDSLYLVGVRDDPDYHIY